MLKENLFWVDSLGRKHAKITEDINEDGTYSIFHKSLDSCRECGKTIKFYKEDYCAYDPLGGMFNHYAFDNNYCEDCAKKITKAHRQTCERINIFAPSVTIGAWKQNGYHETTYFKSKGCEVSPEYDMDCERIEDDPSLNTISSTGVIKLSD